MKKLYFLYLLFIFFSCTEKKELTSNSIKVNPEKASIQLNKLFTNYKVVYLDTENIIPTISSIFVLDSLLLIVDAYSTESLYFFDLNGNFKEKWSGDQDNFSHLIGGIKDVRLNPINKFINILTDNRPLIIQYDMNGTYVRTDILNFSPYSFAIDHTGRYYFDLSNEIQEGVSHNLMMVDKSFTNFQKVKPTPLDHLKITITTDKSLQASHKYLYYAPCMEQAIYTISDTTFSLKYKMDYSKSNIPVEYLKSITDSSPIISELDNNQFAIFPKIFVTANEIIMNTLIGSFMNGYKLNTIIRESDQSVIQFSEILIEEEPIDFQIIGTNNDDLILVIHPEQEIPKELITKTEKIVDKSKLNHFLVLGKVSWE